MKIISMLHHSPSMIIFSVVTALSVSSSPLHAENRIRHSAAINCPWPFYAKSLSSVSIQDLSRLSAPVYIKNNFGIIAFSVFDNEDRPIFRNFNAIGIVYASRIGIGTKVEGVSIYTKYPASSYLGVDKLGDTKFYIETYDDTKNCRVKSTISLSEKGEIRLGSKVIGQVRDEIVP